MLEATVVITHTAKRSGKTKLVWYQESMILQDIWDVQCSVVLKKGEEVEAFMSDVHISMGHALEDVMWQVMNSLSGPTNINIDYYDKMDEAIGIYVRCMTDKSILWPQSLRRRGQHITAWIYNQRAIFLEYAMKKIRLNALPAPVVKEKVKEVVEEKVEMIRMFRVRTVNKSSVILKESEKVYYTKERAFESVSHLLDWAAQRDRVFEVNEAYVPDGTKEGPLPDSPTYTIPLVYPTWRQIVNRLDPMLRWDKNVIKQITKAIDLAYSKGEAMADVTARMSTFDWILARLGDYRQPHMSGRLSDGLREEFSYIKDSIYQMEEELND